MSPSANVRAPMEISPQRRVRVWFGQHAICDYRADADLATRYAAAMNRRFAGLRITNQLLWPLTAL